jgi:hypothetical protein
MISKSLKRRVHEFLVLVMGKGIVGFAHCIVLGESENASERILAL